jgi:hypothetical protein
MANEIGLRRDELVVVLGDMSRIFSSRQSWTTQAPARNILNKKIAPDSSEAVSYSVMGAAWALLAAYHPACHFPFKQVCMALFTTIGQPMITIQEYESRLSFSQMREWLARAIEHAKASDPWSPYLD